MALNRPSASRPGIPPRQSARPASASSALTRPRLAIASAVLLLLMAWLLWPSPYKRVKNLGAPGSTVVAFGDSLTAGYGAGEGEAYPARLASRTGVPIVNAGVSGDTTESALARIDDDVIAQSPRLVIVGLGGNDFLRGVAPETTEANLRTIVRKIQGTGAMVVLLGFRFPSLKVNYDRIYESVAKEEGCLLVPDVLDGILRDRTLKSDEIHPNAKGYDLMAERIEGPFRKLKKAGDGAR